MESEVGLGDIANFILVLLVAVLIPILLNPLLDNKRYTKDFLIDEIRGCLNQLKGIKTIIDNCNIQNQTKKEDKREILSKITYFDLQIASLIKQLQPSFKKPSRNMRESLYEECRDYWKDTTGGELMNAKFKINNSFCKNHDTAFLKIDSHLKKCIHEINHF